MTAQRVADMTIEELKAAIAQVVDERLQQWRSPERPVKKRSFQEIMDSIDRNMWTAPPGSPSTLEILLQERRERAEPPESSSPVEILLEERQRRAEL